MPTLRTQFKDPEEAREYEVNWALDLQAGDSIASADWTFESEGLVPEVAPLVIGTPQNNGTVTKAKVSGGSLGETYQVLVKVTTQTAAEVLPKRFFLRVVKQ